MGTPTTTPDHWPAERVAEWDTARVELLDAQDAVAAEIPGSTAHREAVRRLSDARSSFAALAW